QGAGLDGQVRQGARYVRLGACGGLPRRAHGLCGTGAELPARQAAAAVRAHASMTDKRADPFSAAIVEAAASAADVEALRSDAALPPGLPFSDGVRVGRFVILSGQVGIRPGTMQLVEGGIEAQARQTLDNVRRVLAA